MEKPIARPLTHTHIAAVQYTTNSGRQLDFERLPEYGYPMKYRDGGSSSLSHDIIKIKISKMQANSFRTLSRLSSGKVLLKVQIQGDVRETVVETVESDWAIWDDELHFDTRKGSDITFTILMRHRMRKETTIGWVTEKLNPCLWDTNSVERRLCHDHIAVHTNIHFKIELLPSDSLNAARRQAALKERISNIDDRHIEGSFKPINNIILGAIHLATNDVYSRSSSPANDNGRSAARNIVSAAEALQLDGIPFAETWDPLLSQVKQFTNLVQKIAEVHPYAKFAFSVLTVAVRVVIAQKERDDKFRKLIHATTEVFDFLNRMKVADLDGHKHTVKMLALQTTECAYFIRDYAKHKRFIVRVGASLLSGTELDGKIAEYERKFEQFKTAFRTNSALNIEITVVRIAERMDDIDKTLTLNDLPYAKGVRFNRGKQCLPGTREKILEKIIEWINNIEGSRVLVLSGDAGTGKSTIAHTISRMFDELHRLGSSFFFPRDGSQPYRKLFSTITRDLADLESHWKAAALTKISQSRALRKTGSLLEQYEEFILKPAKNPQAYFGPVLIVIDALDASTHFKTEEREELLTLLFSRTAELPQNFRILITTRDDEDILDALEHGKNVVWWRMADMLDDDSRAHDIGTYFSKQFSRIPGVEWNEKRCGKLIAAAGGDFAWAVSTSAWVKEIGSGHNAAERLLEVLHEEHEVKGLRGILKTLHLGASSRPPSRPSSTDPHRGLHHFFHPQLAPPHSDDRHDESFLRKTPVFKHSDEVKLSPVFIPPYLQERQMSEEPTTPPFSSSVRTVSDYDEVNSFVDRLSTYSYNPHGKVAAPFSEPSDGIPFPWMASPELNDYSYPETSGGIGFETQNIWVQPLNVGKAQYPNNERTDPPMPQPRPHKAWPSLRYVPGMPGDTVDLHYQSYIA
ncbi:hypothetical protein B0H19DRAFT_1268478 [Mycena capillaripes]|nr:hypothetical protein B0H19DRAFT_1268478 [Mycena capillaripes]